MIETLQFLSEFFQSIFIRHVDIGISLSVVLLVAILDCAVFGMIYREKDGSCSSKGLLKYWRIGIVVNIIKFIVLEAILTYWVGGPLAILNKAIPFIGWVLGNIILVLIIACLRNFIPCLYHDRTYWEHWDCVETRDIDNSFLSFMIWILHNFNNLIGWDPMDRYKKEEVERG